MSWDFVSLAGFWKWPGPCRFGRHLSFGATRQDRTMDKCKVIHLGTGPLNQRTTAPLYKTRLS